MQHKTTQTAEHTTIVKAPIPALFAVSGLVFLRHKNNTSPTIGEIKHANATQNENESDSAFLLLPLSVLR